MQFKLWCALIFSSVCAALGQVILKLAATGRNDVFAFLSPALALGIALYGLGMISWIYALSRLPLNIVYPFTTFTLVLVGAFGMLFLGERPTLIAACGWITIIAGVGLVWLGAGG